MAEGFHCSATYLTLGQAQLMIYGQEEKSMSSTAVGRLDLNKKAFKFDFGQLNRKQKHAAE